MCLIEQDECVNQEGKLQCIEGMNEHSTQIPDSSFNSRRNEVHSSPSVLSGLLHARLLARIQPSQVMVPHDNFHSSVRGKTGSRYKRQCFLRMHGKKQGELLFGLFRDTTFFLAEHITKSY